MPTKEHIANVGRRNLKNSGQFRKGSRHSPATEFKKGDVPFNKGLKQEKWLTPDALERTKATRFRKGQLPKTAKPLGHIRRTPHFRHGQLVGYDWYININWKGERAPNYNYRKYLWELFYREDAPEGMIFVSKNGNQSEMPTIENIEMIDRAEHMKRNNPKIR